MKEESDGQSSHDPTVRLMINPQLSPFLALITMMISLYALPGRYLASTLFK